MEGVGDRAFRKAMAAIGGFDEAVTDFIRVPSNAHVASLAKVYCPHETSPIPLAAQIMGSDPELMAAMTQELEKRGAKRVDLNCGCPSNTVTGRGAGSSLLKEPDHLFTVARAMVQAVKIPVTLKMRSGFHDTSLFHENLRAAEESGVRFITLHPRTKVDGYGPPARWDLIAQAKTVLKIPLIGNGDILTAADAFRMVQETKCDGVMIGRGAIINPFIFHEIKAYHQGVPFQPSKNQLEHYFRVYLQTMDSEMTEKGKINKLKQLMGFHFKRTPLLQAKRQEMLTRPYASFHEFFDYTWGWLKTELFCGQNAKMTPNYLH